MSAARKVCQVLSWLLVLALMPAASWSQMKVAGSSADSVTLELGGNVTPQVGATARVCRLERIGAKDVDVCVATIEIVDLAGGRPRARIVKGNAADIRTGDRIVMTAPAVAPPTPTPARQSQSIGASTDPLSLSRAGDLAIAKQQWGQAVEAFRRILILLPNDPNALRQLAVAEAGAKEAALRAEIRKRRQQDPGKFSYLEESLSRATAAGDRSGESSYAALLLELDPTFAPAQQVRERERQLAAQAAQRAVDSWDTNAIGESWREFAIAWHEPDVARPWIDALASKFIEWNARLLDKDCSNLAQAINEQTPSAFSAAPLLEIAESQLLARHCAHQPLAFSGRGLSQSLATILLVNEAQPNVDFKIRFEPLGTSGSSPLEIARDQIGAAPFPLVVLAETTVLVTVVPGGKNSAQKSKAVWQGVLKVGEALRLCVRPTSLLRRTFSDDLQLALCSEDSKK